MENNLFSDFYGFLYIYIARHDRPVITREFTRRSPVYISIARLVKDGVRLRLRSA